MTKQQPTEKQRLRLAFSGDSDRLFRAVWRRIVAFRKESEIDDVYAFYDATSSELVNDSTSEFYMYG